MKLHSIQMSVFSGLLALAITSPAMAAGRIIITEIMYNPASEERRGETEWIEIANVGDAAVDLTGWHFDDEDRGTWGPLELKLEAGEVAVIISDAFRDEAKFRAAWDSTANENAATSYKIAAVKWGGLANAPKPGDEVVQLLDANEKVVCEVDYLASGDWPKADGASIWLSDLKAENLSDGKLWRLSKEGDGPSKACITNEVFNKADVGSPGLVPGLNAPEASSTLAKPEEKVEPVKEPESEADTPGDKKDDTIPY